MRFSVSLTFKIVLATYISLVVSSIGRAANSPEFLAKFNSPIELSPARSGTDKLNMSAPEEGYYSCIWLLMGGDPFQLLTGNDIDNTAYTGFNLHADGTLRLRMKDKNFEREVFHWRHNPSNGRVVFTDGPLAKIFEWPIHLSTWSSTRWISRLSITSPINTTAPMHSVTCTKKDNLIPES